MAWGSSNPKSESKAPARDAIENIIGPTCTIRGHLSGQGAFRIDGTIEGSVESAGAVIVGEGGSVQGDVRGSNVVIAGQVSGNVISTGHLEIMAKGKVEGDIEARSMRIETGGVFRGTSRMGDGEGSRSDGVGAIPSADGELSTAA